MSSTLSRSVWEDLSFISTFEPYLDRFSEQISAETVCICLASRVPGIRWRILNASLNPSNYSWVPLWIFKHTSTQIADEHPEYRFHRALSKNRP